MGLFGDLFRSLLGGNDFGRFVAGASDQELSDAYEKRRLAWKERGYDGTGEKTPEMKLIDAEMTRRSNERWRNGGGLSALPASGACSDGLWMLRDRAS